SMALRAWKQNDLLTAEPLLAQFAPGEQGTWEARHLRELCRRKALALRGHTSWVSSVAISSSSGDDGKRIVSGGYDSPVRAGDSETGKERCALKGHLGAVLCVAISPDGTWAVSGSLDRTIKIWDLEARKVKHTLRDHSLAIHGVAISGDGTRIV